MMLDRVWGLWWALSQLKRVARSGDFMQMTIQSSVKALLLTTGVVVLCATGDAVLAQETPSEAEIDPDLADNGPIGRLSARLAYNSDTGGVAALGFSTNRLMGQDQTLEFNLRAEEDGTSASFRYNNDALFGSSPQFGLNVLHAQKDAGDIYDFNSRVTRLEPRLTWQLSPQSRFTAYGILADTDISNVPATTSALIRADEGRVKTTGIGGKYEHQFQPAPGGSLKRARVRFGLEYATSDADNDHIKLTTSAQSIHVLAQGRVVLRSQLRLGTLQSQSGTSSIGDRYMLGQASIRGFEFGGFGPRDLAVDGDPALGGNSYGVAKIDVQFPGAFGEAGRRVTPGLFVDVGSLWNLDDVAGGIAGADPVDDSARMRASIGVSLSIKTGIGPLKIHAAHPIASEDYDRTQTLGVELNATF